MCEEKVDLSEKFENSDPNSEWPQTNLHLTLTLQQLLRTAILSKNYRLVEVSLVEVYQPI